MAVLVDVGSGGASKTVMAVGRWLW